MMKTHRIIRIWLAGLLAAFSIAFLSSCGNPFDPLSPSGEIKGLTYIDFSQSWSQWNSTPEYDGLLLTIDYFNEFGDGLEFKDKSHAVQVEFYTQRLVNPQKDPLTGKPLPDTGTPTFDQQFFVGRFTHKNSDDDIRIPKEMYVGALAGAGFDLSADVGGVYIIVRVFPPQGKPLSELLVGYPDQLVFKPFIDVTPNP
jgi:hypothetical protein